MKLSLKSLTVGLLVATAITSPATAVVAVSTTIDVNFFYDINSGEALTPSLGDENTPAILISEDQVGAVVTNPNTGQSDSSTVQYTINNNTTDWDIVTLIISNDGFGTQAFARDGVDCITVETGPCWQSQTTLLEGEDELTAVFGDDRVLHVYDFNERGTTDTIFSITDQVIAPSNPTGNTAILAGTIVDDFFFDFGVPASNVLGFAINGSGQGAVFSNVDISSIAAVPLPAGAVLLGTGLLGLGALRKKRS